MDKADETVAVVPNVRLKYQICDVTNNKMKHMSLINAKNIIKIYLRSLSWKNCFVLILPNSHSLFVDSVLDKNKRDELKDQTHVLYIDILPIDHLPYPHAPS